MGGLVTIYSYAPGGYRGHVVAVEVDCRTGIPGMDIVGLPASEVREARERARVAIRNSGFEFPARRILVSLSPADVPKIGNGFDLAIAAAILYGSGQLSGLANASILMIGELHLDGAVGPVRGTLAAVAEGRDAGMHGFVVPSANLAEARSVETRTSGIGRLRELPNALEMLEHSSDRRPEPGILPTTPAEPAPGTMLRDYRELRGQSDLKRVLEIAAAGGHHALVVGPPGGGKSAAIGLYPTIALPLSRDESIEVTRIHSLAGETARRHGLLEHRPFRAPHHNASTEGLLGGRMPHVPGEVALAHRGTLFLDEALEFRRPVLQGLREPLEHHRVRVVRAKGNYWFPAAIQLLLATNQCPCGLLGRSDRECLCSLAEVDRYWRRLGGPLLDRIDLRVHVAPLPLEALPETDSSAAIACRVRRAGQFRVRVRRQAKQNRDLTAQEAGSEQALCGAAREAFAVASSRLCLSTRASLSVLRVARTVADLDGALRIREEHVLEAVSYRRYGEQRPLWEPEDGSR